MRYRILGLAAAFILAQAVFAFGQTGRGALPPLGADEPDLGSQFPRAPGQRGQQRPARPALPTPRLANGRVNLGPTEGQAGLWLPGPGGNPGEPWPPRNLQIPFQPWARELFAYRRTDQLEPHTRCKPSGGPRQFLTPYGVEFVDLPELQRIFIMDVGGPHTYRVIFMDGRPHPQDLPPSYYGHSTGRWEGDTLVIDTVGFNERFWLSRGLPSTEQLHMIERVTRTDSNTAKYEVTIDDPGAYTAPWTSGFELRWQAGTELFEYICQENNFAPDLMLGIHESMDRRTLIVP